MKLVLPEDTIIHASNCITKKLSINDAEYIYAHYLYQKFTSINYIKERIQEDIALGIKENGKLIGWIMHHDDRAIGLLNVLPEHRKKGYGYQLTLAMINVLKQEGELPFVHIEEDNINSMCLVKTIGFKEDRRVHWLKLEEVT